MINTVGIIGAIIVTYSNIPQILLFFKQGHARGISVSSNWLGFVGLLCRTIFLIYTTNWNLIVLIPYFFALFCTIVTFYYIYFPRNITLEKTYQQLPPESESDTSDQTY